jgi:hypothetical protein
MKYIKHRRRTLTLSIRSFTNLNFSLFHKNNKHNSDVDDVKFVINYDFPSNIEDYVHRIGRTGRSNNKGTSYTFMTQANGNKVDELIQILQETNQVNLTQCYLSSRYL